MEKQEIQLEIVDDKVKVTSPYNQEFVNRARNLRGSWKDNAWWFDDGIIDYVRELMMECFNTTGETPYQNVSLLVKDFTEWTDKGPVIFLGITIARAFGRDSGAKLGNDIIFISGDYDSGGSMKNWGTSVSDATFEIQNFPEPSLELTEVKKAIEAGQIEVKYPKKKESTDDIEKLKEVVITRKTYGSSEAPTIYFTEGEQSKFWFENETSAADMFEELKAYQEQGYSIKFK